MGSFNVTTDDQYISGTVVWSETSTDTPNNRSLVQVTMKLSRTNTGYTTYGTGTFHVTVNGTDISSGSESFTITYNSNTVMVSGSVWVTHNADGTKSITIGWSGSSNVVNVNSGSGTVNLTQIDRGRANINVGGTWHNGQVFVNANGWKQAIGVFVNNNGTWERSQ